MSQFSRVLQYTGSAILWVTTTASAARYPEISLDAKDIIRIEIGKDDEPVGRSNSDLMETNRQLRRRVHRLEQALRQVQDQIYRLEERPVAAIALPKEVTCYIKTTFKGTVSGSGGSEAEARAKALKACDDVDGGFSCEDRNVKCGS